MPIKYTVKKGDSPSSIAGSLYDSQRFFNIIQDAAGGGVLQPGMVLKLPDKGSLDSPTDHFVGIGDIATAQANDAAVGFRSPAAPNAGRPPSIPGLPGLPPNVFSHFLSKSLYGDSCLQL